MEDSKLIAELVDALNDIQAELRQMNKTLSALAGQSRQSAGEPTGRPTGRGPAAGRSAGRAPAGRGGRSASYGRSDMTSGSATGDGDAGSRFVKKKSPSRPAGKLPPKKGGGYPKKSR